MATFSKEYYEINKMQLPGDFSIIDEFRNLKIEESISEICEGFGITQIINRKGECWVVQNNSCINFIELIENY